MSLHLPIACPLLSTTSLTPHHDFLNAPMFLVLPFVPLPSLFPFFFFPLRVQTTSLSQSTRMTFAALRALVIKDKAVAVIMYMTLCEHTSSFIFAKYGSYYDCMLNFLKKLQTSFKKWYYWLILLPTCM